MRYAEVFAKNVIEHRGKDAMELELHQRVGSKCTGKSVMKVELHGRVYRECRAWRVEQVGRPLILTGRAVNVETEAKEREMKRHLDGDAI